MSCEHDLGLRDVHIFVRAQLRIQACIHRAQPTVHRQLLRIIFEQILSEEFGRRLHLGARTAAYASRVCCHKCPLKRVDRHEARITATILQHAVFIHGRRAQILHAALAHGLAQLIRRRAKHRHAALERSQRGLLNRVFDLGFGQRCRTLLGGLHYRQQCARARSR